LSLLRLTGVYFLSKIQKPQEHKRPAKPPKRLFRQNQIKNPSENQIEKLTGALPHVSLRHGLLEVKPKSTKSRKSPYQPLVESVFGTSKKSRARSVFLPQQRPLGKKIVDP
jgi:hypothetical protein